MAAPRDFRTLTLMTQPFSLLQHVDLSYISVPVSLPLRVIALLSSLYIPRQDVSNASTSCYMRRGCSAPTQLPCTTMILPFFSSCHKQAVTVNGPQAQPFSHPIPRFGFLSWKSTVPTCTGTVTPLVASLRSRVDLC